MNFWDEEVNGITHIDTEPQAKKFRSSLSKSAKMDGRFCTPFAHDAIPMCRSIPTHMVFDYEGEAPWHDPVPTLGKLEAFKDTSLVNIILATGTRFMICTITSDTRR